MEIALTTVSAADICLQGGARLLQTLRHLKNADQDVQEKQLQLEAMWERTRLQLQLMGRIVPSLNRDHIRVIENSLAPLASELALLQSRITSISSQAESRVERRFSFMSMRRSTRPLAMQALNEAISALLLWQGRFEPLWFLIMRVGDPLIDNELRLEREHDDGKDKDSLSGQSIHGADLRRSPLLVASGIRESLRSQSRSVFLPPLDWELVPIPFSSAYIANIPSRRKQYIVERYKLQTQPNAHSTRSQVRDVRELAHKLMGADPWTFGLFSCKGVVRHKDEQSGEVSSLDIIYGKPDGVDSFQSMRQLLLNSRVSRLSLSQRLHLAKAIAKSVSYVHSFDFVHKNVQPECVLLSENPRKPFSPRFSSFLVGFDITRPMDAMTRSLEEQDWDTNIYHHPSRQGAFPTERYIVQHDIYSLGVCLLEIGLGSSFKTYPDEDEHLEEQNQTPHSKEADENPQLKRLYKNLNKWMKERNMDQKEMQTSLVYKPFMMSWLKEYFVHLADQELPLVMGDRYSAVVATCLTCLDADNEDFGDESEMQDEDGILVNVRFIEKVLLKLGEINV